jgi:tetraacyldisaccharide-1-P 4'-kinase
MGNAGIGHPLKFKARLKSISISRTSPFTLR